MPSPNNQPCQKRSKGAFIRDRTLKHGVDNENEIIEVNLDRTLGSTK